MFSSFARDYSDKSSVRAHNMCELICRRDWSRSMSTDHNSDDHLGSDICWFFQSSPTHYDGLCPARLNWCVMVWCTSDLRAHGAWWSRQDLIDLKRDRCGRISDGQGKWTKTHKWRRSEPQLLETQHACSYFLWARATVCAVPDAEALS